MIAMIQAMTTMNTTVILKTAVAEVEAEIRSGPTTEDLQEATTDEVGDAVVIAEKIDEAETTLLGDTYARMSLLPLKAGSEAKETLHEGEGTLFHLPSRRRRTRC